LVRREIASLVVEVPSCSCRYTSEAAMPWWHQLGGRNCGARSPHRAVNMCQLTNVLAADTVGRSLSQLLGSDSRSAGCHPEILQLGLTRVDDGKTRPYHQLRLRTKTVSTMAAQRESIPRFILSGRAPLLHSSACRLRLACGSGSPGDSELAYWFRLAW